MHNTLEWLTLSMAQVWMVALALFIGWTEYWHRFRGEIIYTSTPGYRGVVPSVFLVIAILGAFTSACARIVLIWV